LGGGKDAKNGFDKYFKPDPNKLTIVMGYINLSDRGSVACELLNNWCLSFS
jgi:hypothetical protein